MRRVTVGIVLVAFAMAGVAGCDDDDSTTSTETLTKDEFVQQANAICAETGKEIDAAATEAQAAGGDQEAFITDTLAPAVESELAAIAALPVPAGEEDQIAAILDAANQGLDEVQADPTVLMGGGGGDPFAEANELGDAYGLTECSGG